ncbi:hypothetical protein QRB32_27695 [Mycobacterium intracellulare subsp. chimaera]|nr:hypothetical protein [Mycobacterium intracellulare]MCA2312017.1 hypothetical protein [Mycobacterium intracellulare subsp. chimaera]MCA2354534.1 hypothetical protein [Mycobacterium intracellulare subsp. chimaera]MDM3935934.1 hypothetical protein [Mycobacterium intracellulare subsp. chimaera]
MVYNMYGSTEVAYATIATPADLAIEPGCVGAVVPGSIGKVFTDDRDEAPAGTPGRIFVGNVLAFEGYTGGGTRSRSGAFYPPATSAISIGWAGCSSTGATTK